MVEGMKEGFTTVADTIKEAFTKAFGTVFDDLDSKSKESAGRFASEWSNAADRAAKDVGRIQPGDVNLPLTDDTLPPADTTLPPIKEPPIPGFATGGFIPSPIVAQVGEIPEFITSVPQMASLIKAVAGGSGEGTKEVNISLQIANSFELQTLDSMTMRDLVRDEIEPMIIDSIETNIKKRNWKEALEIP